MKPRWRKVIHDLLDNRARTLLVVLSIAVGVFSIGVIAGAYQIISNDMSASYSANKPANVELRMSNFDEDVLTMIHNQRGVEAAEGRRVFNMRVRVPGTEKWTTLDMTAVDDFEKNAIDLLTPIEGQIMPKKRQVLLEEDALQHINIGAGGLLEFQLPDGSTKTLPVVGIVQDTAAGAGDFLASPSGYITMDTLQYLGKPRLFNRALVIVSEGGDDIFHIRDLGAKLKDKLEKNGSTVIRLRFSKTHEHPLADTVNAILGILMALGILIVFLSSSLIANTLNALLNQHLRYIGVIKLVGGQRRQVFLMYLILIMAFGILALLMQIMVGLLVPIIAGLVPVINGSRVTVLRALSGGLAEGARFIANHQVASGAEEQKQLKGGEERLPWFDWVQVKAARILAK